MPRKIMLMWSDISIITNTVQHKNFLSMQVNAGQDIKLWWTDGNTRQMDVKMDRWIDRQLRINFKSMCMPIYAGNTKKVTFYFKK